MEEEPLESHTIELADTRPTMVWLWHLGTVPVPLFALIFGITGILFVTISWKFIFAGMAACFLAGRMVAKDYHAITRLERWLNTSAWTLDSKDQGGSSVTPFPLISRRLRGMM